MDSNGQDQPGPSCSNVEESHTDIALIIDNIVEATRKTMTARRLAWKDNYAKRRKLAQDKTNSSVIDDVIESVHHSVSSADKRQQIRQKPAVAVDLDKIVCSVIDQVSSDVACLTTPPKSDKMQRQRLKEILQYTNVARLPTFTLSSITGRNIVCDAAMPNYSRHVMDRMNIICSQCGARLWKGENKSLCCNNGNVDLPALEQTPQLFQRLTSGTDSQSKEFLQNIRSYNTTLAFTSLGAQLDTSVMTKPGTFTFKIHGALYHRIGSLLPPSDQTPKFAQLYFYDTAYQLEQRQKVMPSLNRVTLEALQAHLCTTNPYIAVFQNTKQQIEQSPNALNEATLHIRDHVPGLDRRRYNKPAASELAVLLPSDSDATAEYRDIVLRMRDSRLQRINELNGSYDPLSYILLFPKGEHGWTSGIRTRDGKHDISVLDFYKYRLQIRPQQEHLHVCGKLFHQYIVDMYAKLEQQRLSYIRNNQSTIRAELYSGIQDAITAGDTLGATVGKRVVLPSTFIGGPRHMFQLYQDAMALVRWYGKPDLFITFTCNARWPEITAELLGCQSAVDRPDLCVRVFQLKLQELKKDLFQRSVLGKVVAHIHTIEFQKRGLPHCHLLLILAAEDKPKSPDDFDNIVCAELPDPETEKPLYETVTSSMIHGPCGKSFPNSPCMVDGVCSKRYPHAFQPHSTANEDGYPLYRRRNNGKTFTVKGYPCDNRWIVPYNKFLCTKYNAHINVEVCNSVKAVKYLYKYVYKGHDKAAVSVQTVKPSTTTKPEQANSTAAALAPINAEVASGEASSGNSEVRQQCDEVQKYIDARYISATESLWRLLSFRLHEEYPNVVRLPVHLPDQHIVYFNDSTDIEELEDKTTTMLTKWFELNKRNELARTICYHEVPRHFTWDRKRKDWKQRAKGAVATVGRMYTVQPNEGERFYLRLLLHNAKSADSYEALRTVYGCVCPTFKEAAEKLGLLESDLELHECLSEAATFQSPQRMRQLFVVILLFCQPTDVLQLWRDHCSELAEDYVRAAQRLSCSNSTCISDEACNKALLDIESILELHGKSLADFPPMPIATKLAKATSQTLVQQELSIDLESTREEYQRYHALLNPDQRLIFDNVIASTQACAGTQSFVDGPAGTGKTMLYCALLAAVRANGEIAIAVASSGIAALLLPGGRTAHSRFKIPINIDESSVCNITVKSQTADLIRKAKLVVWDEAPMCHRFIFEALDRTLRDICKTIDPSFESLPFGGKTIVFGGDFRQVLPVVPHGSRIDQVAASLRKMSLWRVLEVYKLTINMRVQSCQVQKTRQQQLDFAEFLLRVGDGNLKPSELIGGDSLVIPASMQVPGNTLQELIAIVYPELEKSDFNELSNRAILTTRNDTVDAINNTIIQKVSGTMQTYLSADSVADTEQSNLYPTEFLNTISPNGIPHHRLQLKLNSPIILLRNLNPSLGLCNGTRLICRAFQRHLIEAEISTGSHRGERVFLPRITLIPNNTGLPFDLRRRQFPVRLAFALTISKAQGQSLDSAGIYLPNDVFSHGQLYTAMSRVGQSEALHIVARVISDSNNARTIAAKNIVYNEVLS